MKLSFEKIKELFPDGKIDRRGKNWITNCPECGEREFSISLEENHLCGCYRHKACGWRGNIFTLAKKIGRTDILVNQDVKFDKIEKVTLFREDVDLKLDLPDIAIPMGWKRIYEDPYLESRKFTQYHKYKVGITTIHPVLSKNFVVFLIEEENRLKGYIGRNRMGKSDIDKINDYYKANKIDKKILRYDNSSTDFGKLVFGVDEINEKTKVLIVVEGIFDKFSIDRLLSLDGQHEMVCICTFKCAMSKEQIFKIQQKGENINTTILLYDPDVIDEIKKTAFDIRDYMGNTLIGFAESGKDPGDFTEEDIEQVFNDLKTPSNFNINKISIPKLKI